MNQPGSTVDGHHPLCSSGFFFCSLFHSFTHSFISLFILLRKTESVAIKPRVISYIVFRDRKKKKGEEKLMLMAPFLKNKSTNRNRLFVRQWLSDENLQAKMRERDTNTRHQFKKRNNKRQTAAGNIIVSHYFLFIHFFDVRNTL